MYRRGYYARDLNSGAPIRFVQFVPRFFPRCPLYSFIISMITVTHPPPPGGNGGHLCTTTHASFLRRAETGSKSAAWNEVLTRSWVIPLTFLCCLAHCALPQYKQLTVELLSSATRPPIFMQLTGQNNGGIACPAFLLARKSNRLARTCIMKIRSATAWGHKLQRFRLE